MRTFMPSVVASCPAFPSKRSKHLLAIMCAVSALVFVCAATGLAQDLKIGFVDLQKFATKSVKAQAMQKKLIERMKILQSPETKKKELADWQERVEKRGAILNELSALKERFQKHGPTLNEETLSQLMKEIEIKENGISELAEEESLERASSEPPDAGKILQRDLFKTIARIQRKKALVMVFNQTAVLCADDALDITDEVVEAYDAEPDPRATAPVTAPAP